jgi:hypothetical protein
MDSSLLPKPLTALTWLEILFTNNKCRLRPLPPPRLEKANGLHRVDKAFGSLTTTRFSSASSAPPTKGHVSSAVLSNPPRRALPVFKHATQRLIFARFHHHKVLLNQVHAT